MLMFAARYFSMFVDAMLADVAADSCWRMPDCCHDV